MLLAAGDMSNDDMTKGLFARVSVGIFSYGWCFCTDDREVNIHTTTKKGLIAAVISKLAGSAIGVSVSPT